MSCSKWAYLPERCDGDFCPGDCDCCGKADDNCALMDEMDENNYEKEDINLEMGFDVYEGCYTNDC